MIAIIDYAMGNLRSVEKAVNAAGFDAKITNCIQDLKDASHIIMPGVGAMKDAMEALYKSNLIEELKKEIKQGKPFLGICLGMQMLFNKSYEGGEVECLSLIDGDIVKFEDKGQKIPHIGWNQIEIKKETPLLRGIDDLNFYFVHSYHAKCNNISDILTTTNYSYDFVSSVSKENMYGVQFHPEKSGDIGIKLLKNFGGIK